jgi:aldehyde oxidoreductase
MAIGTPEKMHPLQVAFVVHGAAQCGFCTPGMVVASKVLLDQNPNPTREEVREWLTKHHNACRCTGYKPIVDAIMDAAKVLRGEMSIADLEYKMPADGKVWGTKYPRPTAKAKVTGTLDFWSGCCPQDARQHIAIGARTGKSSPRQYPFHRYLRS